MLWIMGTLGGGGRFRAMGGKRPARVMGGIRVMGDEGRMIGV